MESFIEIYFMLNLLFQRGDEICESLQGVCVKKGKKKVFEKPLEDEVIYEAEREIEESDVEQEAAPMKEEFTLPQEIIAPQVKLF